MQQFCYTLPIYREFEIPNGCQRSNIFTYGEYVVAYPSVGGVVIMVTPSAVDLQHLRLPHTHDTERPLEIDDTIEDDLANRMLQLGGQWWPDWATYMNHHARIKDFVRGDYRYPPDVHVAYPSTGGVWVYKPLQHKYPLPARKDEHRRYTIAVQAKLHQLHPRMKYLLTMDDKCDALERLGAVFFNSIEDCPDVAKTVAEAKEMFEPYELLRTMTDEPYSGDNCVYESPDVKKSWESWGSWKPFGWGLWTPWH